MSQAEQPMVKKSRKGCKIGCAVVVILLIGPAWFYGPALIDFLNTYGIFFWRKPEKHAYSATSEQNLKAIYQGLMLYHESEGQFPNSDGWMDAIENRIKSNDLAKGESGKKLIRPDLLTHPGEFGYAMNDAASAKYKDDVKDPATTPLIYESKETAKNAHGDPAKDRDGLAISVSGAIIK